MLYNDIDELAVCSRQLEYVNVLLGLNKSMLHSESLKGTLINIVEFFKNIFKFIINLIKGLIKLIDKLLNGHKKESSGSVGGAAAEEVKAVEKAVMAHGKLEEVRVASLKRSGNLKALEARMEHEVLNAKANMEAELIEQKNMIQGMRDAITKATENNPSVKSVARVHDVLIKTNAHYKHFWEYFNCDEIFLGGVINELFDAFMDNKTTFTSVRDVANTVNSNLKRCKIPKTLIDTTFMEYVFELIEILAKKEWTDEERHKINELYTKINEGLKSVMIPSKVDEIMPLKKDGSLMGIQSINVMELRSEKLLEYFQSTDIKIDKEIFKHKEREIMKNGLDRAAAHVQMAKESIGLTKVATVGGRDSFQQLSVLRFKLNNQLGIIYKLFDQTMKDIEADKENVVKDPKFQDVLKTRMEGLTLTINILNLEIANIDYLNRGILVDLTLNTILVEGVMIYALWDWLLMDPRLTRAVQKGRILERDK